MENVRSYCDDILDVIHKFGEEYIYDPRTKIIDGKDLFVSVDNNINNDIAYSDDSDNRSNEACVNLGLTFAVGQHCEKLRVKYVDAIKSRLLGMDPKARMVYAEEILQRLYEIQLNHPIFHSKVFQKFVIPIFFSDVTEAFERYDINLRNVLIDCQKRHGTFFCYWLKFFKPHSDTIGVQRCIYSESDIIDDSSDDSQDELLNYSQSELSNVSDNGSDRSSSYGESDIHDNSLDISQKEPLNYSQSELSNVSDKGSDRSSSYGENDILDDSSGVSQKEPLNYSQSELSNVSDKGSDMSSSYGENDILDDSSGVSQKEPLNYSQSELSNVSDKGGDKSSYKEDRFYNLFNGYNEDVVHKLIEKLEEFNIVREQRYVHKTKNHLAKLIIFMKDQEILRYSKMIIVARIFYDYFNVVVSKASIGENSVTERNLREIEKKGIEGLSKEEISNFKLICAHFSK
ncbi:hypothetical protein HMPREF1075_02858 [Parabacteroides distasonis CL03T12C09]|uniref:hypothetical protein n=3 Tax=Parabacteroides distasonis TaxID=823 RepID=UPI0002910BF6|nr:hypothetical protein [Parabacteroides distasonis]EKN21198.1 hypothetical protein HMPREF1075_02858 [Parabacteroides distasonis CL03T12C09]